LGLVTLVTLALLLPSPARAEAETEGTETDPGEIHYVQFSPNFVVNLHGPSRGRFLMVTMEGMARRTEDVEAIEHHMPGIRHHVLMLLSEQSPDEVKSAAGKQRLMHEALVRIQEFLVSETGEPSIDAVYFTDFVVE
jgi:flagellar FliL protein